MVIYYEDLNYENITEEVDYETFQFVSDVGGTIGLWIGLSMISFFEVVQFLYEIAHYVFYMKPKLARERARKRKQREAKHHVVHALRFINTNGLAPMTTAATKLMGSPAGSSSKGQGSSTTKPSMQPSPHQSDTSAGSAGDSGTGNSSWSSGNEDRSFLSTSGQQSGGGRGKQRPPWYSASSGGAVNPAFESDQLSGLKGLGLMPSPHAYLKATAGSGLDHGDVSVEIKSHNC